MRQELVAIALLIATILPATAQSQYDNTIPPERMNCVGKLRLTDDSKYIRLDTDMMHGKKFNNDAVVCREAIIDPKQIEKVRAICEIGDICRIEGMIKGFGRDVFDWTRIDRVKKGLTS